MSEFIYEWEKPLYKLAFQGFEYKNQAQKNTQTDELILNQAYQIAKSVTKANSKTFFLASSMLPKEKQKAIRALYAFCRITDDLVDLHQQDPRQTIEIWRNPVVSCQLQDSDLIALAWANAREKYEIPWHYTEQLIQGVSQDFMKTRYSNFEELTQYCYGVASTVGLMSMHIIGFKNQSAYTYAIRLGVALQLTNILRDIGEDWEAGRFYLPQEELKAYGLSEEDVEAGKVTRKWREFMRFQISRNRRLYAEAKPGIGLLNRDGRFAIAAAADLYENILAEIEKNDYNVFNHRAHVSNFNKIKQLPAIWKKSMMA